MSIAGARPDPFVFEHKGRADQAFYGEYYALPDYFADPKTSAVADVAAAVLQTRLIDTVREKLGMTYSPMVNADSSMELRGEGYLTAAIKTPEANFAAFHAMLAKEVQDLAAKPIGADELQRARQPLIETERKKQETNDYWLRALTQLTREPRARDKVLQQIDDLSAVTAADVQAFAARFMAGKEPLVAIAKAQQPQASAATPAAAGTRQ